MCRRYLVAGSLLIAATTAHADPATGVRTTGDETVIKRAKSVPTLPIIIVENLLMVVPPVIYYWRTPDEQKVDWAFRWNWSSWREKLTSFDPIVLDTNNYEANAVRHPMVGAMTYQIGRANG